MSCSTLIIHIKWKIILNCAIDGSKNAAENVFLLLLLKTLFKYLILEIFMLVKNSKYADLCIDTFLNG